MLWKEVATDIKTSPYEGNKIWGSVHILLDRSFQFKRGERSNRLRMILPWPFRKKDEESLLSE